MNDKTRRLLLAASLETVLGQLLSTNNITKFMGEDEQNALAHALGAAQQAVEICCEQEFEELFPHRMSVYLKLKRILNDTGE